MENHQQYFMENFDVIVIGAGHAGVEAGLVAARLGGKLTLSAAKWEKQQMLVFFSPEC